jgi:hypothetical protein
LVSSITCSDSICPVTRIRSWPSVCRVDSEMDAMRIRLKTRILVALIALGIFLAFVVFYGNYARTRGVIGVTEDTPANNVRVLLTAMVAYEAQYHSLPPSLSSLGPPSTGQEANRDAANLIDSRLALGSKNGYVFHYVPNALSGSFSITADPSGNGSPSFHYFSDQTGIVRFESGHAASASSQRYQGDN